MPLQDGRFCVCAGRMNSDSAAPLCDSGRLSEPSAHLCQSGGAAFRQSCRIGGTGRLFLDSTVSPQGEQLAAPAEAVVQQ